MHSLHAPVLSLAPDSLASLGDLDGDSLSELWGVFTKCKDSLQNGRRLENLSWRLWFDSGRRDSRSNLAAQGDKASRDAPFTAEDGFARAEQEGWSDPEEWTEAESDDSEMEQPQQARAGRSSRRGSGGAAARGQQDALPVPASQSRSGSSCTTDGRPCLSREWRSQSTISGGSIQRIITGLTSLPPLSVPIKAHSAIDAPASPLISPGPGVTSRHSSAPDELERAPIAVGPPPPAILPSQVKTVDAPTQTTPSTSHRPSPKMSPLLSSRVALSPAGYIDVSAASTSRPAMPHATSSSSSSSNLARTTSAPKSSSSNLSPRRQSGPRPPPSSPASFIHDASHPSNLPPAIRAQSSAHLNRIPSEVGPCANASFEGRSFVKGFDTTVFDSRPTQGSIAPPPTPAVALSKLAGSPPNRAPSALKVSSTSTGNKTAPVATGKGKGKAAAGKKIFFISSPNSDSDDDGSSCHSRSRSVASAEHKRPSISTSLGSRLAPEPSRESSASRPPPPPSKEVTQEEEEDWDDEDEEDDDSDSSSGWGSEYSTEDESRVRKGKSTSAPEADSPLFAKRPSLPAVENPLLKPRPPGLLSQLFHPDLFIDDSDRRHSTVDVSRQSSSGKITRPSLLQTSKSTGVLSEQLRSKSFLKGAPPGTEMESSSEEEGHSGSESDDYEDEQDSPKAPVDNAIATALARHQQRMRLEAAGPIAPPQTPRTTRRAMLATELSESLRRNLLWERQTRNRVMGGPVNRFAQVQAQGVPPNAQPRQPPAQTAPPAVAGAAPAGSHPPHLKSPLLDGGLRAPHPSPATREHSPAERSEMVRRHTTGTGLYLAAQRDKFPGEHRDARRKRRGSHSHVARDDSDTDSTSDSSSSSSSEDDEALSEGQREVRERRRSDARAAKVFGDVWSQRVW